MLSYKLSQLLDKVIERCFRHIAMGRRNWLQTGSHFSALNLAFMFGVLESCKLNKVNFGENIEDILTRILCGEEVDASFLPCDFVRHFRWYGCGGNEDIPSRRLIVKFKKIKTFFKNTGTANPLIKSGDAVLVVYFKNRKSPFFNTLYPQ